MLLVIMAALFMEVVVLTSMHMFMNMGLTIMLMSMLVFL